ncbi:MAG: M24 family metallopeptidase [Candidatus Bathyarchaeia archaeon]|nr:M24 family metallopeptidase [Candidatus Bathyarchaeota archaeon]
MMVRRRDILINKLELQEGSCIILTDSSNLLYFAGVGVGCLIIDCDEATLILPKLEEEEVKAKVGSTLSLEVYGPEDRLMDRVVRILSEVKPSTIFFDKLSVRDYEAMGKITSNLRECMDTIWEMRMKKDSYEMKLIARAAEIARRTMDKVSSILEPGISEWELAVEAEYIMRKMGAESVAFQTIVASSSSSSKPHAKPSYRRIEENDIVVIDLGAVYESYRSDMTRTFLLGDFKHKYSYLLEAVHKAKNEALNLLRPGMLAREIDKAARKILVDLGYGEYFIHGLGHGVGLDIHEPPYLSPIYEKPIPEDCVVTIEPGIYIPGMVGVRDEDMYVVGEEVQSLTSFNYLE